MAIHQKNETVTLDFREGAAVAQLPRVSAFKKKCFWAYPLSLCPPDRHGGLIQYQLNYYLSKHDEERWVGGDDWWVLVGEGEG